jgi:hypothetical protein
VALKHPCWVARSEHALVENIPAAPAEVRDFYADLRNIIAVHPLVVAVTPTTHAATGDGYVQTYRIRDRIPFGPLTLPVAYTATVEVPAAGDLHTEARQFPAVRLLGVVSFEPTAAGTRLTERLTISAPRPLAAFTVREAVAAHAEMLAGLRARFERV